MAGQPKARYEQDEPDRWALYEGYQLIAGVDEVGRGAMAGPLVAAAVILTPDVQLTLVNDSKLLTPEARDEAYEEIRGRALAWATGVVEADMVDRLNVWGATCLAMRRALDALSVTPEFVLVDGLEPRGMTLPHMAFVGGDACSQRMGAASIMAKVTRDRAMERLSTLYPGYALHSNKGYATPEHKAAVRRLGPCALHRRRYWFITDMRSDHLPFDAEELRRVSHYGGD
ncbi:MAG: ribonuclease HII [candidate division WS1 bacterium]|jgi:ribonuclease HII|nr:ribonuclease HII [candidate division WS1 bacterium]